MYTAAITTKIPPHPHHIFPHSCTKLHTTGSIPRCQICSHYPVHNKNNSYFVVIKPHLKKDLFKVYVMSFKILPGLPQRLSTVR